MAITSDDSQNLRNPLRSDVSVVDDPALARELLARSKRRVLHEQNADRRDFRRALLDTPQRDPNGFERIIGESDLTSINFLDRGRRAADAVCRIRVPSEGGYWTATGFMVGPRLLVTNNHVLPSKADAAQARCEFGYEHDLEGALKEAVVFNLRPDELFVTHIGLDVTFVAVVPFSDNSVPISRYGYLPLIPRSGKAISGEWVTIIQHPNGQPKQIAVKSSRIIDLPESITGGPRGPRGPGGGGPGGVGGTGGPGGAVIHYTTDTEPGSSGSPVLNDQWQVVALHHRAIPAPGTDIEAAMSDPRKPIQWIANEGIRISALYDLLEIHRFSDQQMGDVLARLEQGLGVAPITADRNPLSPSDPVVEAKPIKLTEWTSTDKKHALGYDPDFIDGVGLPLDTIIAPQRKNAAPLLDGSGVVLDYLHFSVVVNADRHFAMITAVNIDGKKLINPGGRSDAWKIDLRMEAKHQPGEDFYVKSRGKDPVSFSRGHLVRRVDPCWGDDIQTSQIAEAHSFHYTNATPQVQFFNDVDWGNLEDYILAKAQDTDMKLTVFTGPCFRDDDPDYGADRKGGPWKVPVSYWKIAVIRRPAKVSAAAFMIGQTKYLKELYETKAFSRLTPYSLSELQSKHIQTTIPVIEEATGLNFKALRRFNSTTALESTRQTRIITAPEDIII